MNFQKITNAKLEIFSFKWYHERRSNYFLYKRINITLTLMTILITSISYILTKNHQTLLPHPKSFQIKHNILPHNFSIISIKLHQLLNLGKTCYISHKVETDLFLTRSYYAIAISQGTLSKTTYEIHLLNCWCAQHQLQLSLSIDHYINHVCKYDADSICNHITILTRI